MTPSRLRGGNRAGQSAAPSSRSDPDAERAALLGAIGARSERLSKVPTAKAAMGELAALADRLRGGSRMASTEVLQRQVDARLRPRELDALLAKLAAAGKDGSDDTDDTDDTDAGAAGGAASFIPGGSVVSAAISGLGTLRSALSGSGSG